MYMYFVTYVTKLLMFLFLKILFSLLHLVQFGKCVLKIRIKSVTVIENQLKFRF